jgi:hypothetical protein
MHNGNYSENCRYALAAFQVDAKTNIKSVEKAVLPFQGMEINGHGKRVGGKKTRY